MADWENESSKLVPSMNDKWEGEDEDEDIKDNWDDEDEVSSEAKSTEENIPKKKKRNMAKIIAEKEEKKRLELEEKKKVKAEEEEARKLDPLADKLEKQRLQEESDLMLAKEAFGVDSGKASPSVSLDTLPLFAKEDFDEFRKLLVAKFHTAEKSAHYVPFVETTFREICVTLEPDDIKRIQANLNALFNEKIKAQKPVKAGKKKKGVGIKMERWGDLDFNNLNDGMDDMEDFM